MGSSSSCFRGTNTSRRPRFSGGLTPFVDDKKGESFWWIYLWESYLWEYLLLCFYLESCYVFWFMYGHVLCFNIWWTYVFMCDMYPILRLAWTSMCVWTNLCYGIYPYCLYIRVVCGMCVLFSISFIFQPSATCFWRLEVIGWMEGNCLFIHRYNSESLVCIDGLHKSLIDISYSYAFIVVFSYYVTFWYMRVFRGSFAWSLFPNYL